MRGSAMMILPQRRRGQRRASRISATRIWLVRAERSTAAAANLKLFFSQETRCRIARLLHRIEYDIAAEGAVAELRELCAREGIFRDYLADFITEVCVHEAKVRTVLRELLAVL